MFLLILLSLIFIGLAIFGVIRGQPGERFDAYFWVMLVLAGVALILPIRHQLFEYELELAVEKLLDKDKVKVSCNSYFDSLFHLGAAGFVYRGEDIINLEVRTCSAMRDYLDDPAGANGAALYALHVLTHEAMHVAGEYVEITADCQAFQRNHRTAMHLGVPGNVAVFNARTIHRTRSPRHPYYSAECEPGGALDEQLPDAIWSGPN